MNGGLHSLKAKAEEVSLTRPRSSHATPTSHSERGLIDRTSVAFLTGCRRCISNQL